MKPAVTNGVCRLRSAGHCQQCLSHDGLPAVLGPTKPCGDRLGPWNGIAGPKPGTELKRLLARMGITPTSGCQCNAMAAKMDAWGERCGEHVDEIVVALETEAKRRGWRWPVKLGARAAVRLAIWLARRKASSEAENIP